MNRVELQHLAETRLAEAQVLVEAGKWSGAYYLVGYAVECGLKACIAKGTKQDDFPGKDRANASHSHNLAQLVGVAGIRDKLREESEKDAIFSGCWGVVSQWAEESRYQHWSEPDAVELVRAVSDPDHGVIRWLRTQW